MTYCNTIPKRKFRLAWKDGGQETIEGRGITKVGALVDAFKRVGYTREVLGALVNWEEC